MNSKLGEDQDDALGILLDVFVELKSDSGKPITAYLRLSRKIAGLGPAFGTKFLYFASSEADRAPIFEAIVVNAPCKYGVRDSKGKWLSPIRWKRANYQSCLDFCVEACREFQVTDQVKLNI